MPFVGYRASWISIAHLRVGRTPAAIRPRRISAQNYQALFRLEPLENLVHDFSGQQDFSVRYGDRGSLRDGAVERVDQVLHAGLEMEIVCQETACIRHEISQKLRYIGYWRKEFLSVALESLSWQRQQYVVILI